MSKKLSARALLGSDGAVAGESCRLQQPVDIAWLSALRIFYGCTLFVSMARFIARGWIDALFVQPRFHLKYWGFAWVQPLSPTLMHALFWALAALALSVAIGFLYRVSALLLLLGFTYLQLVDATTYLNHYYFASLLGLLLVCSPAHRAWSLDVRLRPALRATAVPAVLLGVFRFQVAVVYTFAALAKAHGDWLWHAQPLRIWLSPHADLPWLGWLFAYPSTAYLMSWGGFLFDLSVPWLLMWRRTRSYAYAVLVAFHALVGQLFPIGMFPALMITAATVFFEPDWPRRLSPKLRGGGAPVASRASRASLALAALYCVLQLALPLRSLRYGGDVRWHEQGMRFSWRVMVREKSGSIVFDVRDEARGQSFRVPASRYLTAQQERESAGQPDLILQLAHHVARDFAARGLGPVQVRVDAQVSFNGRPSAAMIDPRVDLTQVEDGLGQASWILPAPAP